MTSVIIPPVDLAPGMPSRVVTISATDVTEGGQSLEGQMVRFALSDTLDVSSSGDVIAKTQAEVVLDANGEGSIRLPVYDEDVKTWCGQDWAILVTTTWGSQKAIRVPAGTSDIALSALPPVRPLRGREKQWAITGVSIETSVGSQWDATVKFIGGILGFELTIPSIVAGTDVLKIAKGASNWDFIAPGAYGLWGDHANGPTPETAQTWIAFVSQTPGGSGSLVSIAVSWNNPAQMWTRRKSGGTWGRWWRIGADLAADAVQQARQYTDQAVASIGTPSGPGGGGTDVSIHQHAMRLSDLRTRVGAPSTGGKAAITLICDHGTNKFASIVLPLLRQYGLQCTLALNSEMYNPDIYTGYANENETTWSQIKGWHDTDGIEIANHGRTHKDATGDAAIRHEIEGGREELEAALPGVPIDTWVQIGTSGDGTKWDGFEDGNRLHKYWTTTAGRVILDAHAVVTGLAIHGGDPYRVYPLTGHPPQGASGYWLDTGTGGIDTAKTKIDQAVGVTGGLILRLHPRVIDLPGMITTQMLDDFFAYLAGRRDAGELVILPYREWALATT